MARFQLTKLEERIVPSSCWFGGYSGRGGSGRGRSGGRSGRGSSCRGRSGKGGKGNNGWGNGGCDGSPNGKTDRKR